MPENEKQTDKYEDLFKTKYGKPAWQDRGTDTEETPSADSEIGRQYP